VSWTSLFGADLVSVGNTFTVAGAVHANGRLFTLDDRVVTRDAVDATEPPLPAPWPRVMRRTYEVPPGAGAAAIQRTIDAAARDGSERPVVHLPAGTFTIDRTLVVPPSDVQLVGDGKMTVLDWRGTAGASMLTLETPSHATLREFLAKDASQRIDFGTREIIDSHLSWIEPSTGTGDADHRDPRTKTGFQKQHFGCDIVDCVHDEIGTRRQDGISCGRIEERLNRINPGFRMNRLYSCCQELSL